MRRTVIVSAGLLADLAGLEGKAHRADEFLEGAAWLLERDAEKGRRAWGDAGLYFLQMTGGNGHPTLRLSYAIDSEKVVLLALSELIAA